LGVRGKRKFKKNLFEILY
jgi:hypothetical protein